MLGDAMSFIFSEADTGPEIDVAGARHTITLSGQQTGGEFATDVISLSPQWAGPPPHVHRSHGETFTVLAGRVAYQLGETRITGAVGSTLYVPKGVRHAFANPHDEPARLLNIFTPAGYENFFGELAALVESAHGQPTLPAIQALFAKYDTIM